MRLRYMDRGNSIRGGKNSILPGQSGQNFHSLLCFVTIALLVGVTIKPLQHDGSDRIAGRSRRVLEWLPACSQDAKELLFPVRRLLRVKKASRDWIEETAHHAIGDATRKIEVAEVGSRL